MGERSDNLNSGPDGRPLNAEALEIMRYATIAGLKADCAELSALYASLSESDRARLRALVLGPYDV